MAWGPPPVWRQLSRLTSVRLTTLHHSQLQQNSHLVAVSAVGGKVSVVNSRLTSIVLSRGKREVLWLMQHHIRICSRSINSPSAPLHSAQGTTSVGRRISLRGVPGGKLQQYNPSELLYLPGTYSATKTPTHSYDRKRTYQF